MHIAVIIGVTGLFIGSVAGWGLTTVVGKVQQVVETKEASRALEDAYVSCSAPLGITVGDDGRSMSIDVRGTEDSSGAELSDAVCVLNALDVPDYVLDQIDHTRALDGTLNASWDNLSASWNYHPNSGMSMSIHVTTEPANNS